MKIVLLGPPGVGKGTIAKKIVEQYNIPYLATGDLVRAEIRNDTELGKQFKDYSNKGLLVPDEIIIETVHPKLKENEDKGFLSDGYPRTLTQGKALRKFMDIDIVLNFNADKKKIIERLSGRRVCSNCQITYHIKYFPAKEEGVCDKCGGELIQREDDKPEMIEKRLRVYEEETEPLIDYYRNEGVLADIDANYGPDELGLIFKQCVNAISEGDQNS